MSLAWRWLSRLLLALLALILLLAAIWTYGRLTSPTASQQAAIDRMQRDEPGKGENGFELLMALPPGPEGGLPAVLRCDERASCIAAIDAAPEASAAAIDASRERLEAAARALRAPVYRDRRAEYLGRGVNFLPTRAPRMSTACGPFSSAPARRPRLSMRPAPILWVRCAGRRTRTS